MQRVSLTTPDFDSSPQREKEANQWLNSVWSDWGMSVDGLIAEDDPLWMWQQLGVLPETKEFIVRAIK